MNVISLPKNFTLQKPTIAFITGQTMDCITTIIFLSLGGTELNPLPGKIGWLNCAILKLLVIALVSVAIEIMPRNRIFSIYKWTVASISCLVVIWNIIFIVLAELTIRIVI